jgi:hypothetical protein
MQRPEHPGTEPTGELMTPVVAALLVLAIGATLVGITCRGGDLGADPPAAVSAPTAPATTAFAG